jgi:hypothetical protein
MTRIEIRIRSLVLHGAKGFAGNTFCVALGAEIERRIATGTKAAAVASRFRGESKSGPALTSDPGGGAETTIAARVAGRLLP